MTLDEAIAELHRVTPADDPWTGEDVVSDHDREPYKIDHAIAAILNAVIAGELRKATEVQARLEAAEAKLAQWDAQDAAWAARVRLLTDRIEAADAEVARLRGALVEHNDLMRSTFAIAERECVKGMVASTNWDAFYNRVAVLLKKHHAIGNEARTALQGEG